MRIQIHHRAVACGLLLALVAVTSQAARWREVGQPDVAAPGMVYVDLDAIHDEDGYRIALFLTILAHPRANPHDVKMDRFTQKTAFDCAHQTFALISTVAYLEGKKVGGSKEKPDWKNELKAIPPDAAFSQRVLQLACKAIPVAHPRSDESLADSAATVVLPSTGDSSQAQSSAPAPH
jgi:hypothetical protein